jgi:hypothetical protein
MYTYRWLMLVCVSKRAQILKGANNYLDVARDSEASLVDLRSDERSGLRSKFSMLPQGVEWRDASTLHMDCMWESREASIFVPAMAVLHWEESVPRPYRLSAGKSWRPRKLRLKLGLNKVCFELSHTTTLSYTASPFSVSMSFFLLTRRAAGALLVAANHPKPPSRSRNRIGRSWRRGC